MTFNFNSLIILLSLSFLSCVSVNLGSNDTKSYENISYSPPNPNYVELNVEAADKSWQNTKNGNTISFMSACNRSTDPNLEILSKMALDGVEEIKIIHQKKVTYNGREALNTQLLGRVDGVPIQAELTVLKKNNCVFNITYIGSINSFMTDLPIFNKFFAGLRIK